MSPRLNFDVELEKLNNDLIKMGGMIEEAIGKAITAFRQHDTELAKRVVEHDHAVDEIEKKIEHRCLTLIMRQQPVAKDLRTISTALKMVTDMERIADNAADISEITMRISHADEAWCMAAHIPDMAEKAVAMVDDAVLAFVRGDVDFANAVIERDDEVDELFNRVKTELADSIKRSTDGIDGCIDVLFIAKYLERIADHAVNICEWVEFHETGELKHTKLL